MNIKLLCTIAAAVLFLSLSACNTGRNGATNATNPPNKMQSFGLKQNVNKNNMINNNHPGTNTLPTKMQMSKLTADQLAAMGNVHSAYVMLTNHNAYVGVTLQNRNDGNGFGNANQMNHYSTHAANTQTGITSQLKQQIADKVQSLNPGVHNVYISADPNLIDLMDRYTSDVKQGHPISGLADQLNTMVQRLFPTNAATGNHPNGTNVPMAH